MRRAIITLLVLLSFGLKAQVYQAMPQAGYGPVKRMLFDSVLTIPLNINQLRNITGGRDAGQIRYNVSDSGLYVFTGYTWIKANLDSVNLSNRINGKLNVTDTAYMLSWYMRKTDTLSLSNRINLRVKYTDTAAMLDPYLRKLDTASLSDRINKKQNAITLTTNFKSGASTLVGATLNIPKYSDTLQDNYVPYVGAIKDVDLGAYKLNANTLQSDYLLQVKNSPTSIAPTKGYTAITGMESGLVLYSSWMTGNTTYTQQNFINYANTNLQNNTRQYNLPVRNGTLALVEDTVNLSNRINLKADKATTLTINGVGYDLSTNRTWTIPTVDTTSLSNRLNLKLNISDTAAMLSPYLRKADTSSLSNRINLKLNSADTLSLSNRINLKADKSTTLSINGTSYDLSANRSWTIPTIDTTSLSNRINLKVNISDTAAMLSPYLRKVDTTNAFLTAVSQPNDSTLSFVKGSTLTSYTIRASTQGSAVKLITNVYNNSGATILKGSVVYINGAHSSNLPTIALAIANNESTSAFTYGLVESNIPNNSAGTVVQNGVLTGLNLPTSSYTDGQTLYLSPTVAGGYTTTKVIAPNHYVAIGTVIRAHPNFGTIQVAIRNGFQLDELSDVLIAAVPLDSTVLQFSRVDSLWHDVSITNAIGSKYIKPTDTTSLSNRINAKADALSGTTNTVPKFTSSTTIGNSNIKDNGNAVTINATAGSFGALQVGSYNGNILMNTTNANGGLIFQNTSSSNKLWDFSSDNNDLVFNESNVAPVMKLKAGGNVVISNLSGTGTRMVVADANGVLSTQAISSDTTSLSNRINLKLNISDTASMLSPYLRKVDTASLSNRINTKQGTITLTTTGTSGAATFSSNTLNIPQYQAAGTYVTSVTGTSPIVSSGGTTPAISIPAATSSVNGYLSSTDWSTFNGKQNAINGTGFVKASGTTISYDNSTYYLASNPNGYTSNTGTVTSVATGLGLSGGTITTSGTLLVDTSSASILSRQRAANTYATTSSLSGYLPLTGGALTGALGGTSATFTSSSFPLDVYGTTNNYGLRINNVQAATLFLYSSNANAASRNWGLFTNYNAFGDFAIAQSNAINGDLTNGANGTSRFYISNGGNIGIGTTTDAGYKLDVNGTGRFSGNLTALSITTSAYSYLYGLRISGNDVGNTIYQATGSLGISTGGSSITFNPSLTTALTLASTGAATFSSSLQTNSYQIINGVAGGTSTYLQFNNNGSTIGYIGSAAAINGGASTSIALGNSSGYGLTINSSSGAATFYSSVTANTGFYLPSGGSGTSPTISYLNSLTYGLSASGGNAGIYFGNTYNSDYSTGMQFRVVNSGGSNVTAMTISPIGNVGIGTTSPANKLTINGSASAAQFNITRSEEPSQGFSIQAGGGITTFNSYEGTNVVYGDYAFNSTKGSATVTRMSINGSGAVTINNLGTGTVYSNSGTLTNTNPSDSSLKNSIEPLSYGLTEILQLQPKTFYYNSDTAKSSLKYGFVAQDVQPIMPDIVRPIGNGSDKLGLESDGIYVTMVNAIKELSAQIKELSAKNEALIKRIETLENK
jgi:hypothetical protein